MENSQVNIHTVLQRVPRCRSSAVEVVAVTITAVAVIVVLIEGLPTVGSERLGGGQVFRKQSRIGNRSRSGLQPCSNPGLLRNRRPEVQSKGRLARAHALDP